MSSLADGFIGNVDAAHAVVQMMLDSLVAWTIWPFLNPLIVFWYFSSILLCLHSGKFLTEGAIVIEQTGSNFISQLQLLMT